MKRFILMLFAASICLGTSLAQTMKIYDWTPYKTEFKIPDDFTIVENSGEKFEATGTGINFTIYPKKGENLSLGGMKTSIKDWAVSNGLENIGNLSVLDEEKYHGFWGVSVDGVKSNFPVTQMLLIHPKDNNISFYIWISYSLEQKYLVDQLVSNIKPMDNSVVSEQSNTLVNYTWNNYKTKFKIPDDFDVKESTGEKFNASNSRMNFYIYPRKGENLTSEGRRTQLRKWAVDNNLKDIGEITTLDSEKLNGYQGIFVEGNRNDDPEIYMLIINPKDSNITLYVNLSYKAGLEDLALDILKSIAPMDEL